MRKCFALLFLFAVSLPAQKPGTDQEMPPERQINLGPTSQTESGGEQSVAYLFRLGEAERQAIAVVQVARGGPAKVSLVVLDRAGNTIADLRGKAGENQAVEFGPAEARWIEAGLAVIKTSAAAIVSFIPSPGAPSFALKRDAGVSTVEVTSSSRLAEIEREGETREFRRLDTSGPVSRSKGIGSRTASRDGGVYLSWRAK